MPPPRTAPPRPDDSTGADALTPGASSPADLAGSAGTTDLAGPARAAVAALGRPWHLAVLTGPDAGLVLPLPERGTLGRGEVLTDPETSRRHLRVGSRRGAVLLSDAGSANGTAVRRGPLWLPLGRRPRSLRAGTRLRVGRTVLELRRRPTMLAVAEPPAPSRTRWTLLMPILTVLIVAVLALVSVRTGSRGAVGALVAAPMVLMAVSRLVPAWSGRRRRGTATGRPGAGWRGRRRRVPDPPSLLLAAALGCESGPAGPTMDPQDPGDSGLRAWPGRRSRRTVLTLFTGDRVALTGARAVDALRWWTAQVIARGAATVTVSHCATGPTVRLEWGEASRRVGAELQAARGAGTPERARSILPARWRTPRLGSRWWSALLAAAGVTEPGAPDTARGEPPRSLTLEEVTGDMDRDALRRRWDGPQGPGLPAVIGVGAAGPCRVDLVTDGPHVLLAGTTGSGKSELLTSWLLQLAAASPPSRLSLVLVDYKGGAAFGPLEHLPHTAGVLTDLQPATTQRALSSLKAETRRRERLLAAHGAKDVRELGPLQAPARLVVAVDEFATLAVEHPDVLDALVRVAAQGRSLGIHLLLATQRPAGAVSPMIRANTSLRVCLRVLDPADSRDVLGHDGAARLPPVPGRLLVTGAVNGSGKTLQAPWCGTSRHLETIVAEIAAAARGAQEPWRPWADPLPQVVGRATALELAGPAEQAGDSDAVVLAMTDLPAEQRLGTWSWSPWEPLLVLGPPGAGRTTTALSAARAALARGAAVHLCLQQVPPPPLAPGCDSVGTVVGAGDPRRLARLWSLACAGALSGSLLVVDDAEAMTAAVDQALGPAEGQALLEALVRSARATGTGIVVTAPLGAATARWAASLRTRVVLGASHPTEAALAGLPRGVVTGTGPGRGVILSGAEHNACQIVLPDPVEAGRRRPAPLRLEPLPQRVHPRPGLWAVGGDDARPLEAPTGSVLVVGPAGSGRSTALRALERVVAEADGARRPLVVDDLDRAGPEVQAEVEAALAQDRQVLAAATTERTAGTYRGALATVRERAALVVLWPALGPSQQVAGVSLRPAIDPGGLTRPGCGVLVERGRIRPVQVAHEDAEPPD